MSDDGLIIVGASLAGAKAAEGARTCRREGPIRLRWAPRRTFPTNGLRSPRVSSSARIGRRPAPASRRGLLRGRRDRTPPRGWRPRGSTSPSKPSSCTGSGDSVSPSSFWPPALRRGDWAWPVRTRAEAIYLRTLDDSLALRASAASGPASRRNRCQLDRNRGGRLRPPATLAAVVMIDPLLHVAPLELVLGPEVGAYFAALHHGYRGVDLASWHRRGTPSSAPTTSKPYVSPTAPPSTPTSSSSALA